MRPFVKDFIEVTQLTLSMDGIARQEEERVLVNINHIINLSRQNYKAKDHVTQIGTTLELVRFSILVKESYEQVKELVGTAQL